MDINTKCKPDSQKAISFRNRYADWVGFKGNKQAAFPLRIQDDDSSSRQAPPFRHAEAI